MLVGGTDAAGSTVAALSRQVGLVFQEPDRQIFSGSVQKEVEFGPRNLGVRGAALATATADALSAVGLSGEEATNPYDLGAARRKLLAIASVLAMRTPVLVLDEPTTGQDGTGHRSDPGPGPAGHGRGPDGDRGEPRPAIRGRDLSPGRGPARGTRRPRCAARRGLCTRERGRVAEHRPGASARRGCSRISWESGECRRRPVWWPRWSRMPAREPGEGAAAGR